jgi:uncharacterized protein (UPF0335 family)
MIGHNTSAGQQLRAFVERIERLEEEKRTISEDIKDVKAEAKANGFDVKTINQIVRDRRKSLEQLREEEALLDLYRAALGMLDGTPLGDAARRRLTGEDPEPDDPDAGDDAQPPAPVPDPATLDEARERGRAASKEGKRVIDNPFVAGDPRRAAWDEGWCEASGTDGMEIPEAWRRKKNAPVKPKEEDGEGQEGADDE